MTQRILPWTFATLCLVVGGGADWLQFRGNDGSGAAFDEPVPVALDDDKVLAWKTELEGHGLSAPIIVGDRVIVTSSSGYDQDSLHVVCFQSADGEMLWERQFRATGRTMSHPKTCVAAPTPASDGQRIFAFYSSNDLACLDLEGNLLWYRGLTYDFPNASNSLGMASSPVVVGETVVVQVESEADSFATGIDVATGISRWKISRTKRANWTSPVVLPGFVPQEDLVLLQSSAGMTAVKPRTGKEMWTYGKGASTISSSVVADRIVYLPSHGLTALRPSEEKSNPEVLWNENKLRPATASPVIHGHRIYTINGAGVLTSAETAGGAVAWRLRLKGPFSGTPVLANGHLYGVNEEGLIQVVRLGESEGEVIARRDLGEAILGTPAVADGALYVRSDGHLWKFASPTDG